ncbi:BOW99_gp33 family protein [Streptococcus sp. E17BB]
MKRKKEQWKPKVTNIMADGSVIEDLTGYVIPSGHQYYQVIKRIYTEQGA